MKMKMRTILALAVSFLLSCGGGSGGRSSASSGGPNQPSEDMVDFNAAAVRSQQTAVELATLILGEGGVADKARAIRTMPLTTVAEIQAWRAARDNFRVVLDDVNQKAASFALDAHAVQANRDEFLEEQAQNFPWTFEDTSSTQSTTTARVTQPLLLAALAVATFSITAYKFLKGFSEIADKTQRMVYTTANGSEESRQAVVKILKDNGVSVPESAGAEEVIEIFKEQPRDLRRTITTKVEAWNEEKFFENTPEANDATARFEEAREDVPEIANEGGAFAVSQTVTMVQSVTGGAGNIVGGKAGAAADLALTATEMNPTDIVQRNVTVYVTAGEKQDLPTETSPTPPSEAVERIEQAAQGDPGVTPEQIEDAAIALMQEVAEALRAQFGPAVQIAERVAMVGGSLDEDLQEDGSVEQNASLSLPDFEDGEYAEVLIVRDGILPQEVVDHLLGPDNPIELDSPPLMGTITVDSSPNGDASEGGSQTFSVTADVTRVPNATQLICQGTNAVCSPSSGAIFGDSSASFNVEVFEQAQLRLIRHDTGESYSLILSAAAQKPEPAESCEGAKAHLCEKLPDVGCDISVMDTARQRVLAACGSSEANQFFAQAPASCC